jgi:hypothetical protein
MKVVGVVATALVSVAAAVVAVVAVRSIPDLQRYLKIRRM